MGSKKLALLEHFKEKPTVEQVMEIDGFAEISAKTYVDNYDNFFDFIKDLPVTIAEKVEVVKTSNDLDDMVFVFTGIRMKPEEDILESRGAKIASSVSKNTTHLVCKDPDGSSSKLEKARLLGVKVIGVDEFLKIIN
jgi:NAD-dependent DNA ligase